MKKLIGIVLTVFIHITFSNAQVPTASFTLPNGPILCSNPMMGGDVTINVDGGAVAGPVTFTVDFGDGSATEQIISNSIVFPATTFQETFFHMYPPIPGAMYTIEVTATNASGTNSSTEFVTLQENPVVDISDVAQVCPGVGMTQFTNNSFTMMGNPIFFSWDFGDGGFSNDISPSHNYLTAGNYNVFFTADNMGCTEFGFLSVDIGTVTSSIMGSTAVCENTTSQAYSVNLNSGSSYNWTVNGATVQSGTTGPNNNTITLDFTTLDANITVVETDANGCVGNPELATVTVNTLPITSPIMGSAAVCENTTGEGYSVNLTPGSSYNWAVNGATVQSGTTGPNNNAITLGFTTLNTDITVIETDANGCTGSPEFTAITVNTSPITSPIMGSTTACDNATGGAYSVNLNPGSNYNWIVNGATVQSGMFGPDNNTITLDFTTLDADITVIETDINNCMGNPEMTFITVNPCLTLVADFSQSDIQVCENGSITFQSTSTGASGAETYAWSFGAGATPATATGPGPHVVIYATAGTPSINLTVTDGASNDNNSSGVTVNALPITFPIMGSATACDNATGGTYSVNLNPGSNYNWMVNGATIQSGLFGPDNNAITVDFTTLDADITVIETNINNCMGNPEMTFITVDPCLTLVADFSQSDLQVCENGSVTFQSTSTGTSGAETYAWSFGAGATPATATGAGPHVVIYATAGTPSIDLTVTDGASNDNNSSGVTVNALPITSPIMGSITACDNATGGAYSVNLNPGSNYNWIVNGATVQSGMTGPDNNAITLDFTTLDADITVTETDANGCMGNPEMTFITVDPCLTLVADFTQSETAICEGQTVTYQSTSTGISGSEAYNWSFGNGAIPTTASGPGPHVITYTLSGTPAIDLTVIDGSSNTSKTSSVTIDQMPTVSAGRDLNIPEGESVGLEGQSSTTTVIWTPGFYNIEKPIISPTATTEYTITATNGSCTASDKMTVTIREPILISNVFTPNDDGINDTWQITGLSERQGVLRVFNRWGNLVYEQFPPFDFWNGRHSGTPLPTGTYYYTLDLLDINEKGTAGTVTIIR